MKESVLDGIQEGSSAIQERGAVPIGPCWWLGESLRCADPSSTAPTGTNRR